MTSLLTHRDEHLALVRQLRAKLATAALGGPERAREPVSYTHLTLPTKREV